MKVLLRVVKEAKKYEGLFLVSILSTLLLALVSLAAPRLLSMMTALVAEGLDESGLHRVMQLAAALLLLYLFRILLLPAALLNRLLSVSQLRVFLVRGA